MAKANWACFDCREAVWRTGAAPVLCPRCDRPCRPLGRERRLPPKTHVKAWQALLTELLVDSRRQAIAATQGRLIDRMPGTSPDIEDKNRRKGRLSKEAIDALAEMDDLTDEEVEYWLLMWRAEGEAAFWHWLGEERSKRHFERWLPRFQAYAAERRRAAPAPRTADLTPAEREQRRIVAEKLDAFVAGTGRTQPFQQPYRISIIEVPHVALDVADERMSGHGYVVVDRSNSRRWWDAEELDYSSSYGRLHQCYWWYIDDAPDAETTARIRDNPFAPTGVAFWIVAEGESAGEHAYAWSDVWAWDGTNARRLGSWSHIHS